MKDLMRTFWADESGQDLAEYGLLLALIAVVVAVAIISFRDEITNVFNRATNQLADAAVEAEG